MTGQILALNIHDTKLHRTSYGWNNEKVHSHKQEHINLYGSIYPLPTFYAQTPTLTTSTTPESSHAPTISQNKAK
jgi:hypothetical protein